MSAADEVRNFLVPILGPAWRLQFGRWIDGAKESRYAVLRPMGGLPADLVRRPQFTLLLIGAAGDDVSIASDAAEAVIEATRTSAGSLVLIQAGEPVSSFTDDGRPIFEIAISTITN